MLAFFIEEHGAELIRRCTAKVARRPRRAATALQLGNGIPMFLAQLQQTLHAEESGQPLRSLKISGATGGAASEKSEMGVSAAKHGKQLSALGYSVDQVVHDYGDMCQAITEMAVELGAPVEVDEFRTLNRCLDNVIAVAVAAFTAREDVEHARPILDEQDVNIDQQLLRASLSTALYAAAAMELGNLQIVGLTGLVLRRALEAMRVQLACPSVLPLEVSPA